MGVPFLPTRSSLGTDIIEKWGFAESLRHTDPKIPNKKLVVLDNPFDPQGEMPKVVLVPAINPDVTILHVQKADAQGTARIKGLTFADVEQATSAHHVILTCEELVDTDELKADPDQNQIASLYVDAVAPVPLGAFPTACYRYYDYDPAYLNNYRKFAQDDAAYGAYLKKYIVGTKNHQDLLELVGSAQIKKIMADQRTGYAVGLDRR
jgi:glutaconate CoA-transferase subunit A